MNTATIHQHEVPLRLAAREDFTRVSFALRAANYDSATICRHLKIEAMYDLADIVPEKFDLSAAPLALALFIKLFIFLQPVAQNEAARALEGETLASFLALGLLKPDGDFYYTPVLLHPINELLVVSDRLTNLDGTDINPPAPDAVFPAVFVGTLRFLRIISNFPATDALDLCAGSGVGALALAPTVRRVTSADITDRATLYARFNALLNGNENVEVVQGDLYGAVAEGRDFDLIVAHPPYVPAARDVMVYRDGGTTGETLVQKIVEGLPRYLRPGGMFFNVAYGLDTEGASYEERARAWLGADGARFDIIFAINDEMTTRQAIEEILKRDPFTPPEDIAKLEQAFADIRATRRVYGALVIRRRETDTDAPWTARVELAQATDAECFARAFAWHERAARQDFLDDFVTAKPRLESSLQVKVTHKVAAGKLRAMDFVLETERPFAMQSRVDAEMFTLLGGLGGEHSVKDIYISARAASIIPESLTLADFSAFLAAMIERGYLTL